MKNEQPECPYITGTVTRYCTLTPFTLTDEEREAIQDGIDALCTLNEDDAAMPLRALLKRLG
jgi:hypothetical protein